MCQATVPRVFTQVLSFEEVAFQRGLEGWVEFGCEKMQIDRDDATEVTRTDLSGRGCEG